MVPRQARRDRANARAAILLAATCAFLRGPLDEAALAGNRAPARATIPAIAAPPGAACKIAFVRRGSLWVIGADGSGERRLTTWETNQPKGTTFSRPVWLSQSTLLAFGRDHHDRSCLYRIDAVTAAVERSDLVADELSSPRAELRDSVPKTAQVTFFREAPEGLTDPCVLDLKTGKSRLFDEQFPRRIWRRIGGPEYPSWSPDGRRVVFLAGRGDPKLQAALYVMTLRNRFVRKLRTYDDPLASDSFRWGRDGGIWARDSDLGVLKLQPDTGKVLCRAIFPHETGEVTIVSVGGTGELLLLHEESLYRWNVDGGGAPVKLADDVESASLGPEGSGQGSG
jgi:hypothetical protein